MKALFSTMLGILLSLPSPAILQSDPGSNRVTVEVCCSSQGITDARTRVTLSVDDGDSATPPVEVTADLPRDSTSKDFADRLANNLEQKGIGATSHPPTQRPFNGKDDTCEELELPSGYEALETTVEKFGSDGWQQDDGQLKVWFGDTKASALPAGVLSFHTFDFTLESFTAKPLVMEIYLYGEDLDDGSQIDAYKKVKYPNGVLPLNRMQAIGNFLQSLGMVCTYPTTKKLHVEVDPSNILVDDVCFVAWEETDATSNLNNQVTFRFRAK